MTGIRQLAGELADFVSMSWTSILAPGARSLSVADLLRSPLTYDSHHYVIKTTRKALCLPTLPRVQVSRI